MSKYSRGQLEGGEENRARQRELEDIEAQEFEITEEKDARRKVDRDQEYANLQKKIVDDENKAYQTDKIVDYSTHVIAEKAMPSNPTKQKQPDDFRIVTDQLEEEEPHQEDKTAAAQKQKPVKKQQLTQNRIKVTSKEKE